MIKGNTKSGFEFEIDENVFDDWELIEKFRAIEKGEDSLVVDVIEQILGIEQKERLKEFIRDKNGKVSASGMEMELEEIFEACQAKN